MNTFIRKCEVEDWPLLQDLAVKTFDDSYRHLNTPENMKSYMEDAFSEETLKEELSNPLSAFFFIYLDKVLVGYLKTNHGAAQTDKNYPESLEIERIYIDKAYQGQGLGKVLINKGIDEAKFLGKPNIWLGVWEKNPSAIGFYKKMGFKRVATHDFPMGDEVHTDFIMQHKLA